MAGRQWTSRMLWFIAFWAMSVGITGIVALIIKVWLGA